MESNEKPRKRSTFKAKKPQLGKKRNFREQKSFSFAHFHEGAKKLQDMKAEEIAATLRKLEDSVDDEFFGRFFREMMAKMHKMDPKFKTSVHKLYSKP